MLITWAKLALFVAFVAIPIELAVLYRSKRQDLPHPGLIATFIAWLGSIGLAMVLDVFRRHGGSAWPASFAFATAGALSVVVVICLPFAIRKIARMPSRAYVHALNNQLQAEILRRDLYEQEILARKVELREKLREAQERVTALEHERADGLWWQSRLQAFDEISEAFDRISQEHEADV